MYDSDCRCNCYIVIGNSTVRLSEFSSQLKIGLDDDDEKEGAASTRRIDDAESFLRTLQGS